jgi:NitT/TauT family transport system substrate-binding protein
MSMNALHRLSHHCVRLFAILFSLLLLPACNEGVFGPEKATITIATPGQTNVILLPISIIEQLGYFADEGLDVRILNVPSGVDARNALLDGRADVTMGFYETSLNLGAGDNEGVAFVEVTHVPGLVLVVRSALASSTRSARDLVAKRVGVTSLGAPSHNFARYLLRKENTAESGVTFVAVGQGATAESALESGQIDALVSVDPSITRLVQRGSAVILADSRTLANTTSIYGAPYTTSSFFATRGFIDRNPETTQRITNAAVRALKWMAGSTPEQIIAALPDAYVGGQRDLYVSILKSSPGMYSTDGRLDESVLRSVIALAGSFDASVASANIDVTKTYTNRFVDRAR